MKLNYLNMFIFAPTPILYSKCGIVILSYIRGKTTNNIFAKSY